VTLIKFAGYYQQFEFVSDDLGYLLSRADVVICRAGIGTISEVLTIGKAAIVIPIPNSHQEINAEYFSRNGAIKMLRQEGLNPTSFVREIDALCQSPAARAELVANGHLLIRENATKLWQRNFKNLKK
jgi:UDP-N-acetylglucosamine--N-acetylmuramyl-(pentapeptide) pyrophosphoryl-undecaprenol N-acetylglucosamine transferase